MSPPRAVTSKLNAPIYYFYDVVLLTFLPPSTAQTLKTTTGARGNKAQEWA